MFDSIKASIDAAKNKQGSGANYKNLLSISKPGTYLVRILPNIKNPADSFLHYFHHGWQSIETGQYTSMVSPSTWGERCPVSELYFKIIRNANATPEEIARAKEQLKRKENWLVKVFVVADPNDPENNNTVKGLRYGRQLDKIIQSAISGDDAAEFGAKIFDLSEKGCTLRIKCELVSDKPGAPKYPTYTASRFLSPSAIEGMTPARIEEVYNDTTLDLNQFVEHKTREEILKFIDTHYFGGVTATPATKPAVAAPQPEADAEDVPYTHENPVKAVVESKTSPVASTPAPGDDKIRNLLAGLDNL
jgi:hypothetical protein